jgi:hypothetical protein
MPAVQDASAEWYRTRYPDVSGVGQPGRPAPSTGEEGLGEGAAGVGDVLVE